MVVAFTNHNDSPMGIMNGIILYHFQNQMIFLMLLILMLIRSDDGRGLDLSLGGMMKQILYLYGGTHRTPWYSLNYRYRFIQSRIRCQ